MGNHIQFSNEESINYSPATITAAKKFKRSLGHKARLAESNGKHSSVRKENGPMSNNSSKKGLKKTPSPNSRGGRKAILGNPEQSTPTSPHAKERVNTQMLNAAVIPCTITLNVPAAENAKAEELEKKNAARDSEGEDDDEEALKRKQRLLERTAVRSLGRSDAIDEFMSGGGGKENGRELLRETKGKLTSVRRANQVTSGWI